MIKNDMRPIHPGEILHEDFLVALSMSAHALAKALNVRHASRHRARATRGEC